MVRTRRKQRSSFSFNIKKGRKFAPIPKYTKKQRKQILVGTKKTPSLYAVERKAGKVVKAKKL